ncbi:hypothetical protein N7G274_001737 [Stereocaulon virgatum]|uniref:Uncharacterized protein n=1 Tax=Stereocaulon virgatum TaxID=373712 RepID=A0ABR4AM49_9LECA
MLEKQSNYSPWEIGRHCLLLPDVLSHLPIHCGIGSSLLETALSHSDISSSVRRPETTGSLHSLRQNGPPYNTGGPGAFSRLIGSTIPNSAAKRTLFVVVGRSIVLSVI